MHLLKYFKAKQFQEPHLSLLSSRKINLISFTETKLHTNEAALNRENSKKKNSQQTVGKSQ